MQWKRGWEGGDGGREVERLLSSTSESTVNNTGNYRGRQKKKKEGRRDSGEQEGQGGRQGGRKKGPRRVNITVLSKQTLDAGILQQKATVHLGEKKMEQERKSGRRCECVATSRDTQSKAGKWKVKAWSVRQTAAVVI